ncbi:50S ribosomal protein L25 [Clostridium vincentii]|uniref:Large ribosomal subunit protein bL25 n=1 Tax=Clostridium vincentii TaxID=52704 RepID=A0A2T0BGB1_9CLOT|nr:50S ribosomal protein L25 [Clostridium vincentii]PRR82909.1 General stress protein CTC [Clostridium vincentii]
MNLTNRKIKVGYSVKKERMNGSVPGILYGKKIGNVLVEVDEKELAKELFSSGEHGILNYSINGNNERGVLKEVQRHPVSHKIIHIDLEQISENEEMQLEVPIQYVGEEWLNKRGAILQKEKTVVKVSCRADVLPKTIKIDVSKGEVGAVYRYEDLEIDKKISIIDNIESVIASVSNENKLTAELFKEEIEEKQVTD